MVFKNLCTLILYISLAKEKKYGKDRAREQHALNLDNSKFTRDVEN